MIPGARELRTVELTSDDDTDFREFKLVHLGLEGGDEVGVELDLERARRRNGDEGFEGLSQLEPQPGEHGTA